MRVMTSSVCMSRLRGRAGDQPWDIARTECTNLSILIRNGRFSIVGLSMTFISTNKCVFCLTYSRKSKVAILTKCCISFMEFGFQVYCCIEKTELFTCISFCLRLLLKVIN